jgi:flavin-dependent thymidylate synthase
MEVKLLDYTRDALELLIYTKNTRLRGEDTLDTIKFWPLEKKLEHWSYMMDTIQSSWEFADYTFEITGVTRAFTHQFVRTRTASYAQEAQRVVDLSDSTWLTPPKLEGTGADELFDGIVRNSLHGYSLLREAGVAPQDARGVIPTNIHTSIISKLNLRTLSHMAELRLCTRTQGEYQDVFRAMRDLVVGVHPWAEPILDVYCARHGTCCFPRYTECPIAPLVANLDDQKAAIKKKFWSLRHESSPVAFKDTAATTDGGKV